MKLTSVHYEIFHSDAEWMTENTDDSWHTIDREVRLTFADARTLYVSWRQDPVEYAIWFQDHSFFVNSPDVVLDLTESEIWLPLIGSDVNLEFRDDDHQVLCVESATQAVYCCSYDDGWGIDVVTITSRTPIMPLQTDGGFTAAAERQSRSVPP